jgi:hypothetical protein
MNAFTSKKMQFKKYQNGKTIEGQQGAFSFLSDQHGA